jgi:hypothetical protein
MDAVSAADLAASRRPAFLRLHREDETAMTDSSKNSDEAAWTKMQVDVAVSATKLDAVQSDVRGIREDLRNVYATKTELKDVVDDVSKLKDHVGWLVKSVLGAIVLAVVGLVLSKGGVPH